MSHVTDEGFNVYLVAFFTLFLFLLGGGDEVGDRDLLNVPLSNSPDSGDIVEVIFEVLTKKLELVNTSLNSRELSEEYLSELDGTKNYLLSDELEFCECLSEW